MPAMPIGIYHQGSRLLDTLKSYYQVKEAGMSSAFIYHTRSTTLTTPSSTLPPNTVHLGRDNV
jgi:hypothetical protein